MGLPYSVVSKRDGTVRYCIDMRKVRNKDNGSEDKNAHWVHKHNMHIIWQTIHGLSNRAPPPT